MEHMEKMLSTWVKDQNQHHLSVAMLYVQAKLILFIRICPQIDAKLT